ncbi:hypothetical protein DFJ73DRAFT_583214 [Zopfochytrium polystomum]|nr:hypothetical protein DFJ73DRAFT_583214 [Zopfochytrium polystomum]
MALVGFAGAEQAVVARSVVFVVVVVTDEAHLCLGWRRFAHRRQLSPDTAQKTADLFDGPVARRKLARPSRRRRVGRRRPPYFFPRCTGRQRQLLVAAVVVIVIRQAREGGRVGETSRRGGWHAVVVVLVVALLLLLLLQVGMGMGMGLGLRLRLRGGERAAERVGEDGVWRSDERASGRRGRGRGGSRCRCLLCGGASFLLVVVGSASGSAAAADAVFESLLHGTKLTRSLFSLSLPTRTHFLNPKTLTAALSTFLCLCLRGLF